MMYKLNMGVAQGVITPQVGGRLYGYAPDVYSEKVNDDLTVTAYYFAEGDTRAMIIEATVCTVAAALYDQVSTAIEKQNGIPSGHILLHATHTHSGPVLSGNAGWGEFDSEYAESIFLPTVMKVAAEAVANAEPVVMGVAADESRVGINRRQLKENNVVSLGQNPWGPYDPDMTVISFKNADGKVKASMLHYGCHGTAAGRNHEISRDWSGYAVDAMSEWGAGVCAFFNGPEGDVGPRLMNRVTVGINPVTGANGNINHAIELGHYAAHDAVRIFRNIRAYHDAGLEVLNSTVKLPLKPRPSLEYAKEKYEEFKSFTVNFKAGTADYYKRVIESYENGYTEEEYREIKQTVIRIGDVAFVQSTFELFSEIGLRIKASSPVPYTLTLSNTNGTDAYFVTQSELCRGGYEVEVFGLRHTQKWADNGDWYFVKGTLENLRKLKGD